MRETVLVTGASSGIGVAFAEAFAERGYDLVLVARRREPMEDLAVRLERQHGGRVRVVAMDLQGQEAAAALYASLRGAGVEIDVLVNNAGIGVLGDFIANDPDVQIGSVQLNVITLTVLCQLFGREMARRGHGGILNVASTAAFQPSPHMAVYGATKAYVLSLSEAIHEELKPNGVAVTALCPGPTESSFHEVSGTKRLGLFSKVPMMSAREVAEAGIRAMLAGEPLVVPGVINKLGAFSPRLLPRWMVRKVTGKLFAEG